MRTSTGTVGRLRSRRQHQDGGAGRCVAHDNGDLFGTAQVAQKDVASDPADVGLLGADGVVLEADGVISASSVQVCVWSTGRGWLCHHGLPGTSAVFTQRAKLRYTERSSGPMTSALGVSGRCCSQRSRSMNEAHRQPTW
jgi:hypothetical protein